MIAGFMVTPSPSNNSQIVTAAETICLTHALDESVSDDTTQIANVAHIYDINAQTFSIVDKDNKVAPKLAEISKALNTVQAKILKYREIAHEWNTFRDTARSVQPFNTFLAAGNFIRQATSMSFKILEVIS